MNLEKTVADATATPARPGRGRVVAVNRFYWPDHAATSQILADLAQYLAGRGWSVEVITSRLRYDGGEPLAPRDEKVGVQIRRVRTSRMGRSRLAGRALDYATFFFSAGAALLGDTRRGDVLLITTDPPLFTVVAAAIAKLRGARLVTWNHDIFPEVAAALGMRWADGPLGRLLGRLRDQALRGAVLNVALSDGMAGRLRQSGARSEAIRVVPNWSDEGIRPVAPADNPLRRKWGLEGSFVIGYSGNLGRAHMPDKVAELVRRTRDLPGLIWLFVGGGAGTEQIREAAAEGNVQLRTYQRREDLALSLSAADLHLVALDPACEDLIVPSKISGILAAGRPILYFGDPESAQAREIVEGGLGICLDATGPESWRSEIAALRADSERLREMGRRAQAHAAACAPTHALAAWEAVLAEATGVAPVEAR